MFDYVTTAEQAGAPDYDWVAMKPPCSRVITLNCISDTGNCVGRNLRVCVNMIGSPMSPTPDRITDRETASVSSPQCGPHRLQ